MRGFFAFTFFDTEQEYITALQEEIEKQNQIDAQNKIKEMKEFSNKMPNISSKSTSIDACEAVVSFFVQNCEVVYEITK